MGGFLQDRACPVLSGGVHKRIVALNLRNRIFFPALSMITPGATLPDDLDLSPNTVQVFDYKITQPQFNSKINLTANTFSFLLEGEKGLVTNHEPVGIDNAQFLIMKSGHCLMTELLSAKEVYRSILFFFSDEMMLSFVQKYLSGNLDADKARSIQIGSYDDYIRSFVSGLIDINKLRSDNRRKLLEVKFEEIMLYLLETRGSKFLQFLMPQVNDQTRSLVQVVENNKLNKLTIRELAFLCNMSISTFKREFEKQFEDSPISWFQEQRLEYAAYLLKQKSKRSTEIFHEVGYESLSNFTQAFKAKYGITPKQYQLSD